MKTIAFKFEIIGLKDAIEDQKKLAAEVDKSIMALTKLAGGADAFVAAAQKAQGLTIKLQEVEKRLSEISGQGINKGKGLPGVGRAAQDYDSLVEKAKMLRQENDNAAAEMRALAAAAKAGAGRSDKEYQELIDRIVELKAQQNAVTKNIKEQTREFEAQQFAAGSYRALNAELGKLRASYRDMSEESRKGIAGKEQLKRIQQLDTQLKGLDKQMGISFRNVGNYRDAIKGLNNVIAKFSGFAVFGIGAREVVEANALISDSIADVRKTTNLSAKDLAQYDDVITELADTLGSLDKRTSLEDLLDISRIGGQLGIGKEFVDNFKELADIESPSYDPIAAQLELDKAQAELLGFTDAIDQVNVALGDDLEGGVEDIALDLGKLNAILGVEQEKGVAGGILAIGSAINSLGASGKAQGSAVVDFTKRIGAIAPQANIGAADVLGLGATLDEFGVSSRVAASATGKLLVGIGQDVPRFAKIAGLSVDELSTLLREDGNEAFLQVLEGVKSTGGGVEELAAILEDFGVASTESTQVLGVLTSQQERLRENQKLSRQEFEKATSITEEYNIKNQTLGAELDKLRNFLKNLVVNSGFQDFLAGSIRQTVAFAKSLAEVPAFISENKVAIGLLVAALVSFNAQAIAAQANQLRLAAATKSKAIADGIATTSQKLLNLAMKSNPIGFLVGLLFTLIGAVTLAVKNSDKFRQRILAAWESVQNFASGTSFLSKAVARLIAPLQGVVFVVQNFSAIWAGAKAAASQALENISNSLESTVKAAQIAGKKLRLALTFDDAKEAVIRAEIKGLEESRKALEDAQKPLAGAFADAYVAAQEEALEAAKKAQRSKQKEAAQDREAQAKAAAAERAAQAKLEGEKEAAANRDGYKQKFNQKEQELLEKQAKDRAAAAKKIRELEVETLQDGVGKKAGQAEAAAATDISGAVGDPGQVVKQTELIRAALATSLSEIYGDAREKAIKEAEKSLQEIGAAGGLLPSPVEIQRQADELTAQLETQTTMLYDDQAARLEASAQASIEALTGQPEVVAEQALVIRQQLQKDLETLETDRQAAARELEVAETERQVKIRELQVKSIEERTEIKKAAIRQQLAQEIESINQATEQEIITRTEAQKRIKEAEEAAKAEEAEADLETAEASADIVAEGSAAALALQQEIAQKEIDITKEKNAKILEEERKLQQGRQAALAASVGALSSFIDLTKQLLGKDEENRKKHGKILKALSLGEVAINLVREISAINAANSTYPEPLATIIKVATIAKAVVKAGVAVSRINAQEFEMGDQLPTSPAGSPDTGQLYVAADGKLRAKSAASQAAPGSAQRSASPTLPPADDLGVMPAVSGGLDGYRPPGHLYVAGAGYLPEQGIMRGGSHATGGINVVNEFGDLLELESGEFLLRNGQASYVINKKSTAKFHRQLHRLAAMSSSVYSQEIHGQAAAINSHKGYGKRFEYGGQLPGAIDAQQQQQQQQQQPDVRPLLARMVRTAFGVRRQAAAAQQPGVRLEYGGQLPGAIDAQQQQPAVRPLLARMVRTAFGVRRQAAAAQQPGIRLEYGGQLPGARRIERQQALLQPGQPVVAIMEAGGALAAPTFTAPGAQLATTIVQPPVVFDSQQQSQDTQALDQIGQNNNLLLQNISRLEEMVVEIQRKQLTAKAVFSARDVVEHGLAEIEKDDNAAF